MLSVYEIADAMELRGFGAKKERTWFRTVNFARLDYIVIGIVVILLVVFAYLRILFPGYWVPS
jgi:energy-coupling factor transport system permease protein